MSEDQDDSQKTEQPTGKRLGQARERGQVVSSQEIKHWFMLVGTLLVVLVFLPFGSQRMMGRLGDFIGQVHAVPADSAALLDHFTESLGDVALVLLLPLGTLMLMAIAAPLLQHGVLWSTEKLKPSLDKLNPLPAIKRQFSLEVLAEFIKGLIKIILVAAAATAVIVPKFAGVEELIGLAPGPMMRRTWELALQLLLVVLAVMSVVAGLDYLYKRWDFYRQQRMTKQEVKDEHKESEGDPVVKGRLRQIRFERARRRMMAAVPEADVVVTNPTHFAVAMKYDPATMAAPKVLAKGIDAIALKIRELAEQHDITIVENPPLARALYQSVEIDQEVPPEHYKAVAEVISYVFRLQRRSMPKS